MQSMRLVVSEMTAALKTQFEKILSHDEFSALSGVNAETANGQNANAAQPVVVICPGDVGLAITKLIKSVNVTVAEGSNVLKQTSFAKHRPKIAMLLEKLGISGCCHGHKYLEDAIVLALEHPSVMKSVTKELYPIVADMNDTSPICVERDIRTAIARAYSRDVLLDFSYRPTNTMFINYFIKTHFPAEPA